MAGIKGLATATIDILMRHCGYTKSDAGVAVASVLARHGMPLGRASTKPVDVVMNWRQTIGRGKAQQSASEFRRQAVRSFEQNACPSAHSVGENLKSALDALAKELTS